MGEGPWRYCLCEKGCGDRYSGWEKGRGDTLGVRKVVGILLVGEGQWGYS